MSGRLLGHFAEKACEATIPIHIGHDHVYLPDIRLNKDLLIFQMQTLNNQDVCVRVSIQSPAVKDCHCERSEAMSAFETEVAFPQDAGFHSSQ